MRMESSRKVKNVAGGTTHWHSVHKAALEGGVTDHSASAQRNSKLKMGKEGGEPRHLFGRGKPCNLQKTRRRRVHCQVHHFERGPIYRSGEARVEKKKGRGELPGKLWGTKCRDNQTGRMAQRLNQMCQTRNAAQGKGEERQ